MAVGGVGVWQRPSGKGKGMELRLYRFFSGLCRSIVYYVLWRIFLGKESVARVNGGAHTECVFDDRIP